MEIRGLSLRIGPLEHVIVSGSFGSKFAARYAFDISNSSPELISESPGILLVEFCKGDTSISHDNSAGFQEEKPCPTAVDFPL